MRSIRRFKRYDLYGLCVFVDFKKLYLPRYSQIAFNNFKFVTFSNQLHIKGSANVEPIGDFPRNFLNLGKSLLIQILWRSDQSCIAWNMDWKVKLRSRNLPIHTDSENDILFILNAVGKREKSFLRVWNTFLTFTYKFRMNRTLFRRFRSLSNAPIYNIMF